MIALRKNAREQIRIERQEFKGHDLLNIRVFYDAGDGDYRPGKQGMAVRVELVPELIEAVTSVTSSEVA